MSDPPTILGATRRISIVIPVYNGSGSIEHVVERLHAAFADDVLDIVLVNDASLDSSEQVCEQLVSRFPDAVTFAQHSRNFGEHNAVMTGLRLTRGQFVAVMDDDAQNPPEELPRMLAALEAQNMDVIYGRYLQRKHTWSRRLGSWFNDRMACIMLRKPKGLYLSSFKVMNRFIVNEIKQYNGPFPYIDGLIYRATTRVDQIDVQHDDRMAGASNYTLRRLIRLWLNMFLGFSIIPWRPPASLGCRGQQVPPQDYFQ